MVHVTVIVDNMLNLRLIVTFFLNLRLARLLKREPWVTELSAKATLTKTFHFFKNRTTHGGVGPFEWFKVILQTSFKILN